MQVRGREILAIREADSFELAEFEGFDETEEPSEPTLRLADLQFDRTTKAPTAAAAEAIAQANFARAAGRNIEVLSIAWTNDAGHRRGASTPAAAPFIVRVDSKAPESKCQDAIHHSVGQTWNVTVIDGRGLIPTGQTGKILAPAVAVEQTS
jgi:hypothetical protein